MRLFIVTSVYQFMNALTLQLNNMQERSDLLCIMKLLPENFDFEKLREEKIFDNVYSWTGEIDRFTMIDKNRIAHIKNYAKKVGLALFKKKLLREFSRPDKHYDEICVGYPDYPTRIACHVLKDKDTKLTLLEEGSYTYDFLAQKPKRIKNLAFKLLIGSDVVSQSSKVYVYRPEMLRLGERKLEVVKIRPELDSISPIIRKIYKTAYLPLKPSTSR